MAHTHTSPASSQIPALPQHCYVNTSRTPHTPPPFLTHGNKAAYKCPSAEIKKPKLAWLTIKLIISFLNYYYYLLPAPFSLLSTARTHTTPPQTHTHTHTFGVTSKKKK